MKYTHLFWDFNGTIFADMEAGLISTNIMLRERGIREIKDLDEYREVFNFPIKDYYRVIGKNTDRSVAMFGHGGSFGATFSHLFNVPFPQACVLFGIDFTSIIVVELSDEVGALVYPRLISADDRHLNNINLQ